MSEPLFRKHVHLVVKARGAGETEFVEPGYKLPSHELPPWVAPGHALDLSVEIASKRTYDDWSRAYARQGKADLKVYRELKKLRQASVLEDCHELHYLQMAIEKIARAFLLKHSRGDRRAYLLSHVAVNDFAGSYMKSPEHKTRFAGQAWLWQQVRLLAGEVERLTPAVERQARPDNVEYPWSDGLKLHVPSETQFLKRFTFSQNVWAQLLAVLDEVGGALDP
ncbi:MAG TPA: hypothetical protein VFS43_32105 [Polyangiaceae bacterium]|nr:hypothetical protein [Polyangiaceae bacterium]